MGHGVSRSGDQISLVYLFVSGEPMKPTPTHTDHVQNPTPLVSEYPRNKNTYMSPNINIHLFQLFQHEIHLVKK